MANTYVDNKGEHIQIVRVEVRVPERMIDFVMEHTGRSRRAARRHIADQFLHHGGELSWFCEGTYMGIEDGSFYHVTPSYGDPIEYMRERGIIPYLDEDGNLVEEGGGLSWWVVGGLPQ